ncbi:MAG: hypothetical protein ACI9TV_001823 [Sulfurimonas sp.]|jgi:hypothetical protein|uniref:hypothetical protein n=1 Tax=Sulfurimonas sp. TaxID=2022749 RepID=UPI0039E4738D
MKSKKVKSIFTIVLVSSSLMFSGCNEDLKKTYESIKNVVVETFSFAQGEVEKIIYPVPHCSDKEVVFEVNNKLSNDALYGTHAQVKYGTILLTATNEETDAKSCKAVVTYSIDKDSNQISSFLSKVPVFKNVSKDRTISYTVFRHPNADENLTFIVNVD